jgi:hypothetical protein
MVQFSAFVLGTRLWFETHTKLEIYGTIAVIASAAAIFSFYRAEITHHHVSVAHWIGYLGVAWLALIIAALVAISAVRRTEWFYEQVKARLELPTATRGAERIYQLNNRVLWIASAIEPKVLDRFYTYSGAPMKPSDLANRYPDMKSFWSQGIEYNAECAHALYKVYAKENSEFLMRVLKEVQTVEKLNGNIESLPVLCNVAYIAIYADSEAVRSAWKTEYTRHRPTDKRD